MSSPTNPQAPGQEQPFVSHLVELRDRLIRMLVAVLLVFLVLFPFANDIYIYVATPLMAQLREGTSMIATQVASPFLTPFKLALVSAVFLSMPYLLFQLWSFVAPGLYSHERQLAIPLLLSSILLFYLGMVFAYYAVFPLIFAFLTGTAPAGVAVMTDISHYLDFVLTLFFAFGIAFEIPIATILVVAAGITTPEDLARKRPYLIVGVFVAGMLLTPPDVISQTLLALPMWILFELGVLASRFFQQRRRAPEEAQATAPTAGTSAGEAPPGEGLNIGPTPSSDGQGDTSDGEEALVGRDIAGGNPLDPERFRPLTEEEMEEALDAIEADEESASKALDEPDPVDQKLRWIKELRDQEEHTGVRRLLYEVLEEGDDEQRQVARNILAQIDDR
ncbi:twin-arginine translocase subunit TatC [Candidatus Thiosymbion oneisti]|uniref:twin-arginine translocase subunit TatC n=1 Tax=Candidatus Thiosymbion oneisti TaxID=589554 RepID=UPI000ADBA254|nr:twin-arginine translocase subunit TatC [Candidatus Thiosymbion oneisti]